MKRPAFCMFIHEYAEHAMLFRVFKTDIPGFDSSYRLSTFSTDFSTINYIGESAFQNCKVLKNVTFPNVIVIEKDEETYDKMKENILNNSNDTVQEDKENTIEIEL